MNSACCECGAPNPPSRCSRCKYVYYCNAECQLQSWTGHKEDCYAPRTSMINMLPKIKPPNVAHNTSSIDLLTDEISSVVIREMHTAICSAIPANVALDYAITLLDKVFYSPMTYWIVQIFELPWKPGSYGTIISYQTWNMETESNVRATMMHIRTKYLIPTMLQLYGDKVLHYTNHKSLSIIRTVIPRDVPDDFKTILPKCATTLKHTNGRFGLYVTPYHFGAWKAALKCLEFARESPGTPSSDAPPECKGSCVFDE